MNHNIHMHRNTLITRRDNDHRTTIQLHGGASIGGNSLFIAVGPCAIENAQQMDQIGSHLHGLKVHGLRGGAFKPRTSPYDFCGLGPEGLELLANTSAKYNLCSISEVMSIEQIPLVAKHAHIVQVGSRNMQNFELLKALGSCPRPILLKRGFAATIDELLCAAEYIMAAGNPQIILCERGIRGFDPYTRNVLDLASVAALKQLTHLPLIVDPSHATGRRELIIPMAKAAIAAGADGLMIECHPTPDQALSDAQQTISLDDMSELIATVGHIAAAVGRPFLKSPTNALDEWTHERQCHKADAADGVTA